MERLAFANFGEVVTVFKDRHEFNRKIRNRKKQVKIFTVGGDPIILPRKISFHGSIRKEKEKVVLRLHPAQKILVCLSLSRLVLLGRI